MPFVNIKICVFMSKNDEFEKKKKFLLKHLNSRIKSALNRKSRCEKHLEACLDWESVHHEALLLQSHFYLLKKGMKSIEVLDWEMDNQPCQIYLDPKQLPGDEIKKRFQ